MQSNPPDHSVFPRVRHPRSVAVPILLGLALSITGCSSDEDATTSTGGQDETATAPDERSGPGAGAFPGASGLVAAVDGAVLQVQGASGQVAVTYTDETQISETVAGSATDLEVGACVLVRSDSDAEGQASNVDATSVSVSSPADDGTCDGGGPAGGGGFGRGDDGGPPTDLPSGMPEDLPSDFPTEMDGGPGAFGGGTAGMVTAVDGESFIVEVTTPSRAPGNDSNGNESDDEETTPATVTVTVSSSTTWSVEVDAGADALVVGTCVTAVGETDNTGAVTATSIAVQPAEDGECAVLGGGGGGA